MDEYVNYVIIYTEEDRKIKYEDGTPKDTCTSGHDTPLPPPIEAIVQHEFQSFVQ